VAGKYIGEEREPGTAGQPFMVPVSTTRTISVVGVQQALL
jgi:hypothetical protein